MRFYTQQHIDTTAESICMQERCMFSWKHWPPARRAYPPACKPCGLGTALERKTAKPVWVNS